MKFAERRRRNLWASLRYAGTLALIATVLVAATVGPLYLGWWEAALPAAIGSALAAVLLFAVVVNTPLEAFPFIDLYFERDIRPYPPRGFGRALYRAGERLDAMARAAGLAPLSDFESADPLETKAAPEWRVPEAALPTVEHLLAKVEPGLKPHLEYLRDALQAAAGKEAKFYFLVKTMAGGTNARVEALRHGDLSDVRPL